MVTREDVATRAGVSSATVSYVVNSGPRPVSDETRLRVLRAIEELDYHPSDVARSLKTRRTGTIGFIIPDILNPIHAAIAKSTEDALRSANRNVIICNSDESPELELTYLRMLRSKQVDGLILTPTTANLEMLRKLAELGKAIVLIDRCVEGLDADCVLFDNEAGAHSAVRHLIALGHRRIALVNLPSSLTPGHLRLAGYRRALEEAGISFDATIVREGSFKGQDSKTVFSVLIESTPHPTAVFVGSNRLARGVLETIKGLRLRVPDDIAVAVFDDPDYYTLTTPSITAVSCNVDQFARKAVSLLAERLDDGYTGPSRVVTAPHQLVVRQSTAGIQDTPRESRADASIAPARRSRHH